MQIKCNVMSDSRATDNNMNLNQIAYENVAGNRTFDELLNNC